MIATIVTLAFLGTTLFALGALVRRDADKIFAALSGNSWAAEPRATIRPVAVRYGIRSMPTTPSARQPALRAVA